MSHDDITAAEVRDPNTPRAYSYVRFSTPEQAKGHSRERQTTAAKAWADRHGIDLDTELDLNDLGVSAYSGDNITKGALGKFLEAVQTGVVPKGSWLLVESLDRVSRESAWDASYVMQGIVRAGVAVVDLSDNGREYNTETLRADPTALLIMVMMFSRANNESVMKGKRVADAYARKRHKLASGGPLDKPYTRRLPAWLLWNDDSKQYELIEERAALVRKMFELTTQGWGQQRIAKWFNQTGVDTWGAGGWKAKYWQTSYIRKTLRNVAAIGVFVPHRAPKATADTKRTRTPLEPVTNMWPAAVERELFDQVQSILETGAPRGRNAAAPARSIFAGVMRCHRCGDTVTRVTKGKHQYLVCSGANVGKCVYETVPYPEAEDALVHVAARMLHEAPRGRQTANMDAEILSLEGSLDAGTELIRGLVGELAVKKSHAVREALSRAEAERAEMEKSLNDLRERRDRMTTANVKVRLEAVERELAKETLDVAETNKALRAAVRKMVMFPAEGTLEIWWHHADTPQEVPFASRRMRWDRKAASSHGSGDETTDDNADTGALAHDSLPEGMTTIATQEALCGVLCLGVED
jgi:DNA invertase Pin-like site-specific DNA recombinase